MPFRSSVRARERRASLQQAVALFPFPFPQYTYYVRTYVRTFLPHCYIHPKSHVYMAGTPPDEKRTCLQLATERRASCFEQIDSYNNSNNCFVKLYLLQ